MKTSDHKIILNFKLENTELEEKVQIAMDKYVESVIDKHLNSIVENAVNKRVSNILNANRWSYDGKIGTLTLEEYVKKETASTIDRYINENIAEILAKQLSLLVKEK